MLYVYNYILYERRNNMEVNEFAKIGKGVLTKAIGLQKNYTEEYVKTTDTLDEFQSKCQNCPLYSAKQFFLSQDASDLADHVTSFCSSCSSAVWNTNYKVVRHRINEKNKYGYQPTLKSNAIKLLILYHFLQPDANGFIKNIHKKDLATALSCTVSTIDSCNKILSDYDYCYVSSSGIQDNHISVYLTEYKNYHKNAAEGGRGYLTLSYDMLDALLSIHSLNSLRMQIKGLLEVDQSRLRKLSETTASATYKKLRGFLPRYCKNNVIRKALAEKTSLFTISISKNDVSFSLNKSFSISSMRSKMLNTSKQSLIEYVDHINNLVDEANADYPDKKEVALESMSELNILRADIYKPLLLNLDDYADLAGLATQYNLQIVLSALIQIYNAYILQGKPVNNIGALCRTFIRNRSNILLAA